jgi:UDP-N-acetylmuramoyl-L-alanyl-D-glutamate--2,6-diaminopimelate ligase
MKLYELLKGIAETDIPDREITFITDNSKKVISDCIFVCVKGKSFDGHTVAKQAVENGAYVIVADHDLGLENQIITDDTRDFYGKLCASWFDHPEKKMKFIGVTGTNGKTTMTNVIKHILTENGHKVGLVGTIQNEIGDKVYHTDNTTPMAFELMELFSRMAEEKCDTVVMEVSSFGLVQRRTGEVHFKAAVFTNLTQDHLDYHKDMEDYFNAKKILFEICDFAICNVDDEYGRRLYNDIKCEKYSYSVKGKADIYADVIKLKADETSFWYCQSGKSYNITMRMTGLFNVANVSGAIAVCSKLGIPIENIIEAVSEYKGVKGRCEVIPTGRDFSVICDYAHTPDAVENILRSVKEYTDGRLVCLFGCGGNRDSAKRPLMAKAAVKYADKLIVTSDNPRNEKPEDIIQDILAGLEGCTVPYDVVTDRREAIYHSLKTAQKGDVIVLAGKGHEDYQILADNVHIHFDEREVVADGLKLLKI